MTRNGTVTLLGAGASVEAGYPTAAKLLDFFQDELSVEAEREARLATKARRQASGGAETVNQQDDTIARWFSNKWEAFKHACQRRRVLRIPEFRADHRPYISSPALRGPGGSILFPPYSGPLFGEPLAEESLYLEHFFSFYDAFMRSDIVATQGDISKLGGERHRFRSLRAIAIRTAYRALASHSRLPPIYLSSLFDLPAPDRRSWVVASLNFDMAVEHLAATLNTQLFDGFAQSVGVSPPPDWAGDEFAAARRLWRCVADNCYPFSGFDHHDDRGLLLKLHGSLGCFTIEEGGGDIGWPDELRYNAIYGHFRLPHKLFWSEPVIPPGVFAEGGAGDPVTNCEGDSPSRKSGAVWVRPYLIYARTLKTHPDRLWLAAVKKWADLVEGAESIVVVGYSWGDPHINDMILDAIARGARLINISLEPVPTPLLALLSQRFPTTFHRIIERVFLFGGGAKAALSAGVVTLPTGRTAAVRVAGRLRAGGLAPELSFAVNFAYPSRDARL